jgi:hypothetical protein
MKKETDMPASRLSMPWKVLPVLLIACTACSSDRGPVDPEVEAQSDSARAMALLDEVESPPADGTDNDAGHDPSRIDPCALVTQEEAAAIVKLRLDAPQPFNLGSVRPSCVYPGFPTGPVAKVDVLVGEGAQALVATDRRLNERDPDAFTAIDDLGDEAWLRRSTVYFRRGETWVVVGAVRLIDNALLREPLVAAARAADARLQAGEAAYRP